MPQPAVTADQFLEILRTSMPSAMDLDLAVLSMENGHVKVRLGYDPRTVRAGGSIAGPTIFALGDLSLYAVTMSVIGPEALTVTADITIHFVGKARNEDLVADARVVRAGKTLVVGAVDITTPSGMPIAHVVGSYAVPGARSAALASTSPTT